MFARAVGQENRLGNNGEGWNRRNEVDTKVVDETGGITLVSSNVVNIEESRRVESLKVKVINVRRYELGENDEEWNCNTVQYIFVKVGNMTRSVMTISKRDWKKDGCIKIEVDTGWLIYFQLYKQHGCM